MYQAEQNKTPFLIRLGVPGWALGGEKMNLNYMMNIQPELRIIGPYAVGDFGKQMSSGNEQFALTCSIVRNSGIANSTTTIFLNGGFPLLEMMSDAEKNEKFVGSGTVQIVRAGRKVSVQNEWGVVFTGVL